MVAVRIVDFAFSPARLTVVQGTTVQTTNEDDATHNWTSQTSVWRSGDLRRAESFSYLFRALGQFAFSCTIHPSMRGSVTVIPA